MKISEQIKHNQDKLKGLQDQLESKMADLEKDDVSSATMDAIDSLASDVESVTKSLSVLEKAEKAQLGVITKNAPVIAKSVIIDEKVDNKIEDGVTDFIIKGALVALVAKNEDTPLAEVISQRYGTDEFMKSAKPFIIAKGVQNPAMTGTPAWAGALVRDAFGAFIDLIQDQSIVPQLNLATYSFNGANTLTLGKRTGKRSDLPNLAAGFVKEGDPIRVGAVTLSSIKLTPKSIKVIGTFTSEMLEQSTPNIESMIRKWIVEDTAWAVDTAFLSATAGVDHDTPAGIANGVTPITSGGITVDKIDIDLSKAIDQMEAAGAGVSMAWVMSNSRRRMLTRLRNATGDRAYPELSNGVLEGIRVVSGTNVDNAKIYLIDTDSVAIAGGVPRFKVSEDATLHEEGLQANVKPIVDGSTAPGVTANPVRSMLQTDSLALRMVQPMDWATLRDGSVQIIDTIA